MGLYQINTFTFTFAVRDLGVGSGVFEISGVTSGSAVEVSMERC